MIRVLADSSRDALLIAEAAGGTVRVVRDGDQIIDGNASVECLIVGCRHPIPAGRIQLLMNLEREYPWLPILLITDPEPDTARQLGSVKVMGIVWFEDIATDLQPRIATVKRSVPLLQLARQLEESALPPALRVALPHSLRVATARPLRNVKALANAVRYSPGTLSKTFSRWWGGRATLSQFLGALVILRARQLHSAGLGWSSVAAQLGFPRETLQRKSKRLTGYTLRQLGRACPDQLEEALFSAYLVPPLSVRPKDVGDP